MGEYSLIPDDPPPRNSCILTPILIDHSKPWEFFDGAAQERGCGGGGYSTYKSTTFLLDAYWI